MYERQPFQIQYSLFLLEISVQYSLIKSFDMKQFVVAFMEFHFDCCYFIFRSILLSSIQFLLPVAICYAFVKQLWPLRSSFWRQLCVRPIFNTLKLPTECKWCTVDSFNIFNVSSSQLYNIDVPSSWLNLKAFILNW